MKKTVIIGGGILGSSTAFQIARAGAEVIIVDRQDRGQATAAAAGIICPWLTQRRNKAWYRLAKNGAKFYPTLIKQLAQVGENNTGYTQVGTICLHDDENKLNKMVERALKRREDAPEMGDIRYLSSSETQALFPPIDGQFGSIFVSGGARVNGQALRHALLNGAIKHGATYVNGEAQLYIHKSKGIQVRVNDETLPADEIIITTGAWASEILKPIGVPFNIRPQKAQIIHLQSPDRHTEQWPVIMPPNNQYILSFAEGRIVIGATHEDDVGFDHRVTAGGMHAILHKALEIAPGLADCSVLETKVGFRPVAPGFLPIFGRLPEFPNIIVANGLGASGLTVGPYLGLQLAQLCLDKEFELDLNEYALTNAFS